MKSSVVVENEKKSNIKTTLKWCRFHTKMMLWIVKSSSRRHQTHRIWCNFNSNETIKIIQFHQILYNNIHHTKYFKYNYYIYLIIYLR